MHAMWNAGSEPGRIVEIITPGGFENLLPELGELLVEHANDPVAKVLHELPESRAGRQIRAGLRGSRTGWTTSDQRYGLSPPSH